MRDPDRSDPPATRQSGRRRVVLEYAVEHGVWPARHRESACEDHDRRGSSVYVDCVSAGFADTEWFAIGVVVATCGAGSNAHTGARANITGSSRGIHSTSGIDGARGIDSTSGIDSTCCIASEAGGITCCEQVGF